MQCTNEDIKDAETTQRNKAIIERMSTLSFRLMLRLRYRSVVKKRNRLLTEYPHHHEKGRNN